MLTGVVCAGLLSGVIAPAHAGEAGGRGGDAQVVGGFGLGDGLEGAVDEQLGALRISATVAGLTLIWDSRGLAADRSGLGAGWSISGIGRLETEGGVRLVAGSGQVFELDSSSPTGLHGYEAKDLALAAAAGELPPRAGAETGAGSAAYAYVLRELGGVTTYFDQAGLPVARVGDDGLRVDWRWSASDPHRLERVIDTDGVATALEWTDDDVLVQPGANAAGAVGSVGGWRLRLGGDGALTEIVDPAGHVTTVRYDGGVVSSVSAVSGAETQVTWRPSLDGVARVGELRVIDERTGELVSRRTWRPAEAGATATGWPAVDPSTSSARARAPFVTELADGSTRVESTYSAGALTRREVFTTTGSGEHSVQAHEFTYPAAGEAGAHVSGRGARPAAVTITQADASGATRSLTESYRYDDRGRIVEHVAADGTTTATVYDETVYDETVYDEDVLDRLPVGMPVERTVTAPDGLVAKTVIRPDATGLRAEFVEEYSGRVGEPLVRTARTEYETDETGFVTAELTYPQGGAGEPAVTRRSRAVDLAAGTATVSETVAAGTPAATTTSAVSTLAGGRVLSQTDAIGVTTRFEHDALGRVTAQIAEDGVTTRTAYADGIDRTTVTTPDGVSRSEERDVLGRVARVTDNIRAGVATPGHVRVIETRAYPDAGTVQVTDAWGATTTVRQDTFGRVVQTISPTGLQELTRYDDVAGTVTTAVSPTGDIADAVRTSTARKDERGQAIETIGWRRDGDEVPATTNTFDGLGRPIMVTDGRLAVETGFDPFGNPVTTTASTPDGGASTTQTREFDAWGTSVQKTTTTGTGSHAGRRRETDELGRTRTDTTQHGRATSTVYTPDGLVATRTTEGGAETTNTYDRLTRNLIASITTSPIGEPVQTAYAYDRPTGHLVGIYDPSDRRGTEIRYEHDAHGNVTAIGYPDGERIEHVYDEHGRKHSTTDTAGNRTTYEYDGAGLLTGAIQTGPDTTTELSRVGYEYDGLGRATSVTYGNGVRTAYEFTSSDDVSREVTTGPDGTVQSDRRYTYDPHGNLARRTDRVHDANREDVTTTSYRYDERDRLIESTVHEGEHDGGALVRRTEYELTAAGDIRSETVTTGDAGAETHPQNTTRTFEYSPTGELLAITTDGIRAEQAYDAAGNLVRAADGTTYRYDAANRLVAETTTGGETVTTEYWADGMRAELATIDPRTRTPASSSYYWDGDALIADTHRRDGTEQTASYLVGLNRHARILDDRPAYLTHDRHANVTAVTDAAGRVGTRYGYRDYGDRTSIEGGSALSATSRVGDAGYQPFGHAGEYTDPTPSATQYLRARVYDTVSMRFLTEDPEPLASRYHYGDLNPITKIDPSGRTAVADRAGLGLAVAGLVLAVAGGIASIVFSGGLSLSTFAAGAAGLYDTVAAALEVAQNAGPRIMSDEAAVALGAVSLLVGAATAVHGLIDARQLGSPFVPELPAINLASPGSRGHTQIQRALDLVNRVHGHRFPSWLPAVRIRFSESKLVPGIDTSGAETHGRYQASFFGGHEILLDPTSGTTIEDIVHEIGHYLDFTALNGSRWFPWSGVTRRADPLVAEWSSQVTRLDGGRSLRDSGYHHVQQLLDSADEGERAFGEYLADPAELFARSYVQWVYYGTRAPELEGAVSNNLDGDYWSLNFFDEIQDAVSALFAGAW